MRDRTGLAVLLVALAVLLGLVALVWWINETESDGRWQSDVGRAPAFSSPARSEPPPVAFRPRGTII